MQKFRNLKQIQPLCLLEVVVGDYFTEIVLLHGLISVNSKTMQAPDTLFGLGLNVEGLVDIS